MQNTYPRLERLEAALHGVDNLAGRTIAMDTMAADLAVPIPTLNTTPISSGADGGAVFHTTAVSTAESPSTLSTVATAATGNTSMGVAAAQRDHGWASAPVLLNTVDSFVNATQNPEMAAAADATRKSLATGQAPRTIKALHDGLQELRDDNEALRMYCFSMLFPMLLTCHLAVCLLSCILAPDQNTHGSSHKLETRRRLNW